LNLSGMMRWITKNFGAGHVHEHPHGEALHSHYDGSQVRDGEDYSSLGWTDRVFGRVSLYQLLRPLVVGVVHGLAGSAAIALLVLTTIRMPLLAIAYLLVFGLGTVAGMMLITAAIAVPFTVSEPRFARMNRLLATASGVASLVFGLLIVYEMGFVHGLFTSHPTWTPR
jgi:high-affinity nickel-transport protein